MNYLLYTLQDYPAANIEMYADDTFLYTSDLCPENACRVNEEIMNSLYNWCLKNKLTTFFKKSKHMMIFHKNKQIKDNENLTMKIGTEKIYNVSTYHYLDIDRDSTLSYDKMLYCMYNKNFLVDSGKLSKIDRLNNLHKRAVKLIDNKAHQDQDIAQLMSTYGLESLLKRREKHHLSCIDSKMIRISLNNIGQISN